MVDQAVGVCCTFLDYCGPFIYRHSRYVITPNSCIEDLKAAIWNLEASERRLEHAVQDAKVKDEAIEEDVLKWFHDVKKHKEEMELLIGTTCRGLHHPIDRHNLGRAAFKGKEIIEGLCQKKKELEDKVSYHIHASSSGPSSSLTKSVVFELESRTLILNDVLKALEDDSGGIIGIHGIGGVGKSTLLSAIAQSAEESKRFLKVETLTVPKNQNVDKLRAEVVNLVNEAKAIADEETRKKQAAEGDRRKKEAEAGEGNQRKKKLDTERMLIIIDDFWERIDLTGCVKNDDQLTVKFLFTSRFQDLLSSMNCNPNFKLDVLVPKEARLLLTKLVTENGIFKGLKLETLSDDQLDKTCAGLPLLIDAMAQIMKRINSANPWEDALKQLPRNMDSVDTILNLSYKQLDVHVKTLFSLCALSGKQTLQIQTLIGYSVGLGLFDSNNYTMEAAEKKVGEWVTSLVGSSLLQNGDDNSHVKIHDVVRDFIVKYAFKRPPLSEGKDSQIYIFSRGNKPNKITKKKKKKCNNDDGSGGHNVEIPRVVVPEFAVKGRHVLVLEGEEPRIFISQADVCSEAPESLFNGMDKLKVLHLENMCFSTRFPSVGHIPNFLKELVTLCLHNCIVKDMTGIGNLTSLQVLSFCGSTVVKLLKEVGELSNLRSLDFKGCPKVREIEPGALKGLSRLEQLFLGKAFVKWDEKLESRWQRNAASLTELNSMPHLATLDIIIPDPITMLPNHLQAFTQLQTYTICIGGSKQYLSEEDDIDNQLLPLPQRIMKLNLESSRVLFNGWFQATLQRTQQLHLDGLDDDETNRSSIHELCVGGGFEELKHLQVKNSPSTRYIIASTEWFPCSSFSSLEFLSVSSMMNLEKIGQGLLSPESFGRLKVVKVKDCNSLKSLFCLSSIQGLGQLENIQVYECGVMQAVVVDEDNKRIIENEEEEDDIDIDGVTAKENNSLFFKCLPAGKPKMSIENNVASTATDDKAVQKMSRKVVTGDGKIIMHSLLHLALETLPSFSTFYTNVHSLPPTCLFCDDGQVSLPKLTTLTLRSLERLKEIWQVTNKSAMELDNLQSLVVEECNNLLNIFHPAILLEKKLHKLESLEVSSCKLIQKVFDLDSELASVNGGERQMILSNLKVIKLRNLESLKYIMSNKYPRELSGFQNLTSLDVNNCGELEYLFTSSMAKAMKKLEYIAVTFCPKMKAIVKEEDVDQHGPITTIEFAELKVLRINECHQMKGFSSPQSNTQEVTDKDIPPAATSFFNKKVHLPSLMDLKLYDLGKFSQIWSDETPAAESFSKLAGVEVSSCKELMTAFPAAILDRLKYLRKINIQECHSLKVLFELNASENNTTVTWFKRPEVFSHLKDIFLSGLPNLQHVVEKDSEIPVGFPSLTRLSVSDCRMLRDVMPIATATTLSKLEILTLQGCSMIEEVVHGGDPDHENQIDYIVFPLLTSLELRVLDNLVYFSSASYQLDFPSLKKLSIEECMKMKIFSPVATCPRFGSGKDVDSREYLFNEKIGLPKLEELQITRMNVKELWSSEPYGGSFCQLKLLQVEECDELQNIIIPSFMLQRLHNLASLTVKYCTSVQHIVGGADEAIAFPYLTHLDLYKLENLCSFSQGSEAIRLPSLQDLSIYACFYVDAIAAVKDPNSSKIQRPLFWFDGEISMPSLERLVVEYMTKMSMICYGGVSANGLNKLSEITVRYCDNLDTSLFHLNMLPCLKNLENLQVYSCNSLQVIFDLHPQLDLDEKLSKDILVAAASAISGLRDLYLDRLPELKQIWRSGDDDDDDDPKAAAEIILKFGNLSSVKIEYCWKLSYIFPASAARSLSQLQSLTIHSCGLMKEIVGERKDSIDHVPPTARPNFIFPQLDTLKLENLNKLKRFCGGGMWSYTVECPLLSELEIETCSSLRVLFASSDSTKLMMNKEQDDTFGSDHPMQPLFSVHKDSFPLLKKLVLSDCGKLRRIWQHGRYSTACPFIKLTEVQLSRCYGLEETLFSADTLEIFLNLEVLRLSNCNSLKVIYDVQSTTRQSVAAVSSRNAKLKKLHLEYLPKLEHIWNDDPKQTLSRFQSLTSVYATNCERLEYLFPASVARELLKLREIDASSCHKLKEIIAQYPKGDTRSGPQEFLFPRVTSLVLSDLPELKCLYAGPHVSRWPLLENLNISYCISIRNICDEYREEDTTNGGNPRQPLFWVDRQTKFRNLKTLTLEMDWDMERKWSCQSFNSEVFPKLRVVNLNKGYSGEQPYHLPSSSFIHKLQTEKLTVSYIACQVLFQRHEEQVARFTKLELYSLSVLKNIWEENLAPAASMLINLENLQVSECPELIKVLPSSVCFSSLTSLAVSKCHKMTSVMTLAAAKSLTQLSKMSISECDELVEIVATEKDGGSNDIEITAFWQLKYLELSCLKSLNFFCSGKLYFPLLQDLFVIKCPWLTRLSEGALSTPNLKSMQTERGLLLVRDDFTTTLLVEQLASLESLDMSESPVWRVRWLDDEFPPRSLDHLKTLTIVEGDGPQLLSTAIPRDKALLLRNLEYLVVRNCDALQQVFDDSALLGTAGPRKTICWTHIPVPAAAFTKKRRIDDGIIFKNLRSITIEKCGFLRYILTTAMALNLTQLRDFQIGGCPLLEEIIQRQDDEVKRTRKDTSAIEFPNLETISFDGLPRLERFCHLGNHRALNCPSLKKISIRECGQMKTFACETANERIRGESHTSCISNNGIIPFFCAKVHSPSLEDLNLSNMDSLSTLFPNKHEGVVNLGNLKEFDICGCHKLKYVFPVSVATTLVKLNKLKIKSCGGLEEIVGNKGSENAATCNNGVVVERRRLVFPEVNVLCLERLPELKSFYYEVGAVHTTEWPKLELLIVSRCHEIETLALDIESCSSKTSNLLVSEDHQVQGGHLLDHIIQSTKPLFLIGKDAFPKLAEMTISHMGSMKRIWEIVDDTRININELASPSCHEIILQTDGSNSNMVEDGGISFSFSFRRLKFMVLFELQRLESFSSASCTFSFPSMKEIQIFGCPDMKTFSAGNSLTPRGCQIQIRLMEMRFFPLSYYGDDHFYYYDKDDDEGDCDNHALNTIIQNEYSAAIATRDSW